MSAGTFADGKYETDAGTVIPIRNQPETNSLTINSVANTAPTTGVTAGYPSAKVSGSRRTLGTHARKVTIKFTGGTPDGYQVGDRISLPVFQKATYDGIQKRQTGSYLGGTVVVVSKTPEKVN